MSKKILHYQPQELKLPEVCYKYRSGVNQISDEGNASQMLKATKLEWRENEGIFLHHVGATYPKRGHTDPETMWAVNLAKRLFVNMLKMTNKWYFAPIYLLIAIAPWSFKRKVVENVLDFYVDSIYKHISPFILKDMYKHPMVKELEWAIYSFMTNLGFSTTLTDKFCEVFGTMIEYDTAYKYRFLDIFSETTKGKLVDNPTKEIRRLFSIYAKRDTNHIVLRNFGLFSAMITTLLMNPRIKKAFKIAVKEVDVRKMQYDENEEYWTSFRKDYEFRGKEYNERTEGLTLPTFYDKEE